MALDALPDSGPSASVILTRGRRPLGQTSISEAGWPVPAPQEGCGGGKWMIRVCRCRAKKYIQACSNLSCGDCEDILRARRAASIRDRFEGARAGRPVLYTVFTVPLELRAAASDPKTWAKWRKAIWKVLRREWGGQFGVQRTDPAGKCAEADRTGELCDCAECRRFHPHLNFLWVQRDGFRPWIDLERLRASWAAIIGAEGPVVLWTNYSTASRRLGHWYWYMGRTWPEWVRSVPDHMRVVWYGEYPRKQKRPSGCDRCGEAFWFWCCGTEAAADELLEMGPERLWEWVQSEEVAKCLRFEKG